MGSTQFRRDQCIYLVGVKSRRDSSGSRYIILERALMGRSGLCGALGQEYFVVHLINFEFIDLTHTDLKEI